MIPASFLLSFFYQVRIADRLLNCLGVEPLITADLSWTTEILARITPGVTSLPGFRVFLVSERLGLDQVGI